MPPTPARFEAGTGNIADVTGRLCEVPGLRLIGTADEKASVLSFVLEGFDPQEVGTALDKEGIAVRAGHHCAQPILHRMGVEATVRPSLAFYNTTQTSTPLRRNRPAGPPIGIPVPCRALLAPDLDAAGPPRPGFGVARTPHPIRPAQRCHGHRDRGGHRECRVTPCRKATA